MITNHLHFSNFPMPMGHRPQVILIFFCILSNGLETNMTWGHQEVGMKSMCTSFVEVCSMKLHTLWKHPMSISLSQFFGTPSAKLSMISNAARPSLQELELPGFVTVVDTPKHTVFVKRNPHLIPIFFCGCPGGVGAKKLTWLIM